MAIYARNIKRRGCGTGCSPFIFRKKTRRAFNNAILFVLLRMQKNAETMKERIKALTACEWGIFALSIVAVSLFVAGFCVPPVGVIDGSVLTGIGELFAFAVLLLALHAINKRIATKLQHGKTTLELKPENGKEN